MRMSFWRLVLITAWLAGVSGCKDRSPKAIEATPEETRRDQPVAAGEPSAGGRSVDEVASNSSGETSVAEAGPALQEPKPAGEPQVDGVAVGLIESDKAYEQWFRRFKLDLSNPKMLDEDPDGDGATNREEFMADTDPLDAKSRPGIHKLIRLKEYQEVRVPLLLESVTGQSARVKVTEEGDSKEETVTVGDTLHGMKVTKVAYKKENDKGGQPVDLSRVELDGGRVVLVKDMPAKSASSYAILTSSEGIEIKVHQGETFKWPGQKRASYEVMDLRADQVVVQEVETGRMWTLSKEEAKGGGRVEGSAEPAVQP